MAYFSNGTEGMRYEEKYCSRCANNREHPDEPFGDEPSCAVWNLHFDNNYEQRRRGKTATAIKRSLDTLIPTPKDSIWPGECSMFLDKVERVPDEAKYLKELQDGKSPVYGVD